MSKVIWKNSEIYSDLSKKADHDVLAVLKAVSSLLSDAACLSYQEDSDLSQIELQDDIDVNDFYDTLSKMINKKKSALEKAHELLSKIKSK